MNPKPLAQSLLRRAGNAVASAIDFTKLDIRALKAERDRICARLDSANPPITVVIPVPRVVTLAGQAFDAHEFRLRDLASLQVWLEEQVPHPLAEVPPEWADPDPETRLARLAEAWTKSAAWPPRYGTAEACGLLGTREGRAYFLSLALRRPEMPAGQLLDLIDHMSPLEWSALRRVAYGLTPREEIADELAPDDRPGKTAHWTLSAFRASQHDGGPSFHDLADWTLSQWRVFCSEGRPGQYGTDFATQSAKVKKILGFV